MSPENPFILGSNSVVSVSLFQLAGWCMVWYVVKACLKRGQEVTVMPKTCTSKENSWIGLASYAWSGYVVQDGSETTGCWPLFIKMRDILHGSVGTMRNIQHLKNIGHW